MTVWKNIFTRLPEWWTLLPDQSVIISGGNTNGDVLTSERVPLTVNSNKLGVEEGFGGVREKCLTSP